LGGCHARYATLRANLRRHTFERHHRNRASSFCDLGLLRVGDVHNDAALEHLSQACLQPQAGGVSIPRSVVVCHNFVLRDREIPRAARHKISSTGPLTYGIAELVLSHRPFTVFCPYHFLMARETTSFSLSLPAPPAGESLYRWLYDELRSAILEGRLRPGARLPATRDLAAAYSLSRATIVTAFEQLKSEGYVEGQSGSGTYVSQVLPEQLLNVRGPRAEKKSLPHRRVALSAYARRLQPFRGVPPRPIRAFRANQPALDLFPTTLWAQVAARRLRRVSTNLLAGGEALGYRPLRQAVADYLNSSRGVKCTAEQVLILSGAQEALDRTARILLNPGEPVWMEEPGYPGAAVVFRALGARICPVP